MNLNQKTKAAMNIEGIILDVDRFTSHDGPGIRTTVFLMGCPLQCRWCHSPESQNQNPQLFYKKARCQTCHRCLPSCPHHAIKAHLDSEGIIIDRHACTVCGRCCASCQTKALSLSTHELTVGKILETVIKDKAYYDNSGGGVTLSGGELLMQPEFSYHLLKACKEHHIHTAIETSGFGSECDLHRIVAVTDLILFDIKALDDQQHQELTGSSNHAILRNLESLCAVPAFRERIVIRVPCIPSITDSPSQIADTAAYIRGLGLNKIELLRYNEVAGDKYDWIGEKYKLPDLKAQDADVMDGLAALCAKEGLELIQFA